MASVSVAMMMLTIQIIMSNNGTHILIVWLCNDHDHDHNNPHDHIGPHDNDDHNTPHDRDDQVD